MPPSNHSHGLVKNGSPDHRPHWRVAVLAGGESAERDISLYSGDAVAQALRLGGHEVQRIDPLQIVDLRTVDWLEFDVAFIALHGSFGEDGQVQEILDRLDVPYTGSDALSSRTAFSKAEAKELFLASEIPTPDYHLLVAGASESMLRRVAEQVGYPLVVKPDRQGSSLGISLVMEAAQLLPAWEKACKFDSRILVEQAILGSEWTVPLLDDQVLPVIQIGTRSPIFDYHAKYVDERTTYSFSSNTPLSVVRTIEDAARRACQRIGTRGLCRVDLRLDHANCPWVLEVNTIPGMTDHSLVPKAAARLGWTMTELCERAIESALRVHGGRVHNRQHAHAPHTPQSRERTSGAIVQRT